jgi:phosphatidylglycerol:prolipoprotein diacylglycerol transferase
MWPVLVDVGPLSLRSFGVLLAVAIVVSGVSLLRETRRLADPAIDEARMQRLIWYMVIAAIAGGRLMHVVTHASDFEGRGLDVFKVWQGELTLYGGLFAVLATVMAYAARHRMPILRTCDLVAPAAFLGLAIGRWGSFLAGDDYGAPTASWVGVTFSSPDAQIPAELLGVALHPTQIYLSLKALLLFVALTAVARRKRFDGQVTALGLGGYAVLRALVEHYRGDEARGFVGPLSSAQFISIFVVFLAAALWVVAPRPAAPASARSGAPDR